MTTAEGVRTGHVRVWHVDLGWGVLDADGLPGGCWAHFSVLAMDGYKTLQAGETVSLRSEPRGQDGFDYAATKVWRGAVEPPDPVPDTRPSEAHHSVFSVVFNDGEDA